MVVVSVLLPGSIVYATGVCCLPQINDILRICAADRLPYRMIFAVASEDAVHLYDTQQSRPFAYLANLHYHTLSDLTW